MDLFEQIAKNIIGANQFHTMTSKTNAFPFYNIKKTGDNKYVIEVALCGYTLADLDVTVEKNVLTISSSGANLGTYTDYIFRGFAARKFDRKFTLMDNVKVQTAELNNGILSVWLEELVKENDKPKKINIIQPKAAEHPQLLNEESTIYYDLI